MHVNLFLIGAMKSATSTLHDLLSSIPSVQAASRKELYYFSKQAEWSKGDDYYHSLFPQRDHGAKYLLDSSVSYLVSEDALKRIRDYRDKYGPVKIIVCLRSPIPRAISAIQYCSSLLNVESRTPDEILAPLIEADTPDDMIAIERGALRGYRERNLIRYVHGESDCLTHPFAYLSSSMYTFWLEKWLEAFGGERIHVCLFDEVQSVTPSFKRRLFEFLEIDVCATQFLTPNHLRPTLTYKSRTVGGLAKMARPVMRRAPKSIRFRLQNNVLRALKEKPRLEFDQAHLDILEGMFVNEHNLIERIRADG